MGPRPLGAGRRLMEWQSRATAMLRAAAASSITPFACLLAAPTTTLLDARVELWSWLLQLATVGMDDAGREGRGGEGPWRDTVAVFLVACRHAVIARVAS